MTQRFYRAHYRRVLEARGYDYLQALRAEQEWAGHLLREFGLYFMHRDGSALRFR